MNENSEELFTIVSGQSDAEIPPGCPSNNSGLPNTGISGKIVDSGDGFKTYEYYAANYRTDADVIIHPLRDEWSDGRITDTRCLPPVTVPPNGGKVFIAKETLRQNPVRGVIIRAYHTRKAERSLTPSEAVSLSSLSYDDIVRLADELPPWPDDVSKHLSGLPFEEQYLQSRVSADARTSRWQAQFPGHDLIAGSLLQFFDPNGHVTYNSGGNYVDAFGRDLGTGSFTRCGEGFKTYAGRNAWGFFGAGRTNYFVTSSIGYGAGLFSGFDPHWRQYWLIKQEDQGAIETVVNDDHFNDNRGSFSVAWAQKSGREFFRQLLTARFGKREA